MFTSLLLTSPIFSEAGLKKLQEIKTAVQQLSKQELITPESSVYSKEMINSVLKIIDLLIANPNLSDWSNEKLQIEIEKLGHKLDNESGTFVLEVFNKESYLLAKLLYDLTNTTDPTSLLIPSASKLVSTISNPIELFQTLRQNQRANLDFYELIIKNDGNYLDKQKEINEILNKLDEHIKLYNKEHNLVNLKQAYQNFCDTLINKIYELPYLKIVNSDRLVNKDIPMTYGDFEIKGLSWDYIKIAINFERKLNKQISSQGERFSVIYKHFHDQLKMSECEKINKDFNVLIADLIKDLFSYQKGDFIQGNKIEKFFKKNVKGVNPNKWSIANKLEETIKKYLGEYNNNEVSFRILAMDICRDILKSIASNNNVAGNENVGLGQLSKLLNKYKFNFLDLILNQIKLYNDPSLVRELNKYESELNMKPTELSKIPIAVKSSDNNTTSNDNNNDSKFRLSPR